MKKLLTLLLIFFCLPSWGQKDTINYKSKRKTHFKISYAPIFFKEINFKELTTIVLDNTPSENSFDKYSYNSKNNTSQYSYELGFELEKKLNHSYGISLGLSFINLRTKTRKNTVFYSETNSDYSPFYSYDTITQLLLQKNYQLLSVPVLVNYSLKNKKWFFAFGPSLDFLLFLKTERTIWSQEYGEQTRQFSFEQFDKPKKSPAIYISTIVKFGYRIHIDKRCSFEIVPYIHFGLFNNKSKNFYLKSSGFNKEVKPLILGFNIGFKF